MSLTLKQRKFIFDYCSTLNGTEAAARAYNVKNRNVAGVIAHQNLRKFNVRRVIDEVLEQAEMTNEKMAKNLGRMVKLGSLKGLKVALRLHGHKI